MTDSMIERDEETLAGFRRDGVLTIHPSVTEALGVTADELANMGLRQLYELAEQRGYVLAMTTRPAAEGQGRLTFGKAPK